MVAYGQRKPRVPKFYLNLIIWNLIFWIPCTKPNHVVVTVVIPDQCVASSPPYLLWCLMHCFYLCWWWFALFSSCTVSGCYYWKDSKNACKMLVRKAFVFSSLLPPCASDGWLWSLADVLLLPSAVFFDHSIFPWTRKNAEVFGRPRSWPPKHPSGFS